MSEKIAYRFKLESEKTIDFTLNFNKETYQYLPPATPPQPWTALEFQKCANCPLVETTSPLCPIARGLQEVALPFRDVVSHEKALVIVITQNRSYSKTVTVQEGLFSIFGLIMATSGCPHLDFLRPLSFFHLPFATEEEYSFRILSMYLLQQHMNRLRGQPADFELRKMEFHFADITAVNRGITERIRPIAKRDANLNSLTMLDGYVQLFTAESAAGHKTLERYFRGM